MTISYHVIDERASDKKTVQCLPCGLLLQAQYHAVLCPEVFWRIQRALQPVVRSGMRSQIASGKVGSAAAQYQNERKSGRWCFNQLCQGRLDSAVSANNDQPSGWILPVASQSR